MAHLKRFTPAEDSFIRDNYTTMLLREMAESLGRSESSVWGRMKRLGITVPQHILKARHLETIKRMTVGGMKHRFSKGQPAWNKGMKGLHIGGEATQFKPGHKPANYRPVGSERITVDGYIEVKVSDAPRWKLKHRVVYEAHNGPIPHGMNIRFVDGNKLNCTLSNLSIISHAENMLRNGINRYPEDVVSAIRYLGSLKKRIRNTTVKTPDHEHR